MMGQILHLPSFEQLPCKQHFPDEVTDAYAAVVPYDGVDHLMICKGSHYWSGCLVLTESGWKTSTNNFHRSKGVSSCDFVATRDSFFICSSVSGPQSLVKLLS